MSAPKSYLVECKIQRAGGSIVDFPDKSRVHFRPDGQTPERHVALVSDPEQVAILKGIPEAYNFLGIAAEKAAPADVAGAGVKVVAETPVMSPAAPPVETHTIVGATEVPAAAPAEGAEGAEAVTAGAPKALSDMGEDELRATFEAELGRKPHPQSKIETMLAQIQAKRLESGAN